LKAERNILTPTVIVFVHVTAKTANVTPFLLPGTGHAKVPDFEYRAKTLGL
jgi:hypothetical protein